MSDTRTFKSPNLTDSLGRAIATYWQQNKNAHSSARNGRTRVNLVTSLMIFTGFILPVCATILLVWLKVPPDLIEISFFIFPTSVGLPFAWLTTAVIGSYREQQLTAKGRLFELPPHTKEHRKYLGKLIHRTQVWKEFLKAVNGLTVKELGEIGETAYIYQQKLNGLCNRWQEYLGVVGEAELRVTDIHRQIELTITDAEIEQLKTITTILVERERPEAIRQLSKAVDFDEATCATQRVMKKAKVVETA